MLDARTGIRSVLTPNRLLSVNSRPLARSQNFNTQAPPEANVPFMERRELTYAAADGVKLTGVLVGGSQGRRAPGVVVAHEAPGRDERMVKCAEKLASAGFVALALDLPGATFSV